jgi:hypothetical protein
MLDGRPTFASLGELQGTARRQVDLVQVILEAWRTDRLGLNPTARQNVTGLQAILEASGQTFASIREDAGEADRVAIPCG